MQAVQGPFHDGANDAKFIQHFLGTRVVALRFEGQQIVVERSPTAFGPVSVRAESRLSNGRVLISADLPTRNPAKRTLLRARVPDGWRVMAARVGEKRLAVDDRGTVDLSGQTGSVSVVFDVERATK